VIHAAERTRQGRDRRTRQTPRRSIEEDDAQAGVVESLLERARCGEATVRRICGAFGSPTRASWKKVLNPHSIKPVRLPPGIRREVVGCRP